MSNFKILQKEVMNQFDKMIGQSSFLYTLNLEKNELWELYLNSFPAGTNEIYRERREHDCSCCRHFIRQFGDTVAIINNEIVSLWNFESEDKVYNPVVKALAKHIKGKAIQDVYVTKFNPIGIKQNREQNEDETITVWSHFHIELPTKFVSKDTDSIARYKGKFRDTKSVFKRSVEEISEESVMTILELISQKSLYRGEEWKVPLTKFNELQKEYKTIKNKDVYLWEKSTTIGNAIGKIRNHSIGTLLVNISEGMELDMAVKKYESIVAPTNYKRPKPIFTKKMLEDAKIKLEELGFMDSLQRRYAILEDISVNNILFANRDIVKRIQSNDVFESMEEEIPINPKTFNRVEEVPVETFVKDILPTVKSMDVFVENKHSSNMVSLVAPFKADSKTMFKWDNNFSWAYSGNITDSNMKQNVKNAGGKVDGVLRFSIQWNDENTHNKCDYDAHCIEPSRNVIYYGRKSNMSTTGRLDVDITNPRANVPAVENITWTDKNRMQKGTYKFLVHNFAKRAGDSGFRAEIEFNGEIYSFDYPKELRYDEKVIVAEVTFDGENFTIKETLSSSMSSRDIWSMKSNNFVPVSVMMYSPNYWNEQKGIGNKHYFFMLKGCINDETPNGFFNEFLNNELTEHRKVFEALGSKMKVESVDNQLSGIGFSSTQRNEVIVRVEGQTKRILKVKI